MPRMIVVVKGQLEDVPEHIKEFSSLESYKHNERTNSTTVVLYTDTVGVECIMRWFDRSPPGRRGSEIGDCLYYSSPERTND